MVMVGPLSLLVLGHTLGWKAISITPIMAPGSSPFPRHSSGMLKILTSTVSKELGAHTTGIWCISGHILIGIDFFFTAQ